MSSKARGEEQGAEPAGAAAAAERGAAAGGGQAESSPAAGVGPDSATGSEGAEGSAAIDGGALPVWEVHADPEDGARFYYNPATGETTWEMPEAVQLVDKTADVDAMLAQKAEPVPQSPIVREVEKVIEERRLNRQKLAEEEAALTTSQRETARWYRILGSGWENREHIKLDWRHYVGWSLFAGLIGFFAYNAATRAKRDQEERFRKKPPDSRW